METYKITLKMGWVFIINAESEEDALNKLNNELKKLFIQDGSTYWSSEAMKNIDNDEYVIEITDIFIIP